MLSLVSMLGVMAGTTALFVVLAAFSGLENFIMEARSAMDPALQLSPAKGKRFVINADTLAAIQKTEGVKQASRTLAEKVFLQYGDKNCVVWAKGVDSLYSQVNPIDSAVHIGSFPSDFSADVVVVGSGVANRLMLNPNDPYKPIYMQVPRPGKGQISNLEGAFYEATAYPTGIFVMGDEIDGQYVITPLRFLQGLLHYRRGDISAVELALEPNASDSAVKERLEKRLGKSVVVKTRKEQQAAFYKIMNTENAAAYFIFGLILIIATFGVAASLIALIIEKRENLQTLQNLGLQLGKIKRIIICEGLLVSLIGGLIGMLIGMGLILAQKRFHWIYIRSSFSAIPYPLALRLSDGLIVAATVLFLGLVCSVVASLGLNKKFLEN